MNDDYDDDGDNDNSISMSIYYGGWDGQVICTYSSAPLNDRTNRSGDIDHHASGIFYVDILLLNRLVHCSICKKSAASWICMHHAYMYVSGSGSVSWICFSYMFVSCMHPSGQKIYAS